MSSIETTLSRGVFTITLNRPAVRNAFDGDAIDSLLASIQRATDEDAARVVVLRGAGKTFCAGADLAWMRAMASQQSTDNKAGARRMAGLFDAIDRCPKPVIGRIHGAAIGGGVGLVSCCDIPLAVAGTKFAFSEVRLGLAPAVISPYVIKKIGVGAARELFVTGERFLAKRAVEIGLINRVLPDEAALDAEVERVAGMIVKGGPNAVRACKGLAMDVAGMEPDAVFDHTADLIATLRVSAEGQEGMRAFLTKDKPAWVKALASEDA